MGPRISILLPFRDAVATLPDCLNSIRKQSETSWELVAVDDHSRDGSAVLLRRTCGSDKRIKLYDNPGKGLVDALNFGLQKCCGPLVARMDADDLMHPERLAAHLEHFRRRPELVLSATQAELFPENLIQAGFREYMRWQNRCLTHADLSREMFVESPFAHPSVAYRRDAILAHGGYRNGDFPEDYDLWLRLFQAGQPMEKIPRVLLRWRESPRRLSRTDPRCSRRAFDRLRADYLARDPRLLARRDDFAIWGAGRKTRRRCDHLLEKGFEPRAWIDIDPRKIGNRIDGIPVVGSEWLKRSGRPFVLVYVANHGAREEIMEELESFGYRPGEDCLAVG